MRRRRRINKILFKVTSPSRKKKFCVELITIEKALAESYRLSKKYEENKAAKAIKNNSKYFFNYAKKYSKVKSTIGPLQNGANNKIVSSTKEMAELFSTQFRSVFSVPKTPTDNIETLL